MPNKPQQNWRELSEAASLEQDTEKLLDLVQQLNEVLEHEEQARMRQRKGC